MLFSCAEKPKNNSDDLFTADNHCVESVNPKLDQAKFNLEKLRILYSEKMEKLQVKIDSTNHLANIRNCWNRAERMRISSLKIKYRQQVDLLNDAYDAKYIKFISALGDNLRAIEKCKLIIGEEN